MTGQNVKITVKTEFQGVGLTYFLLVLRLELRTPKNYIFSLNILFYLHDEAAGLDFGDLYLKNNDFNTKFKLM